MDTLIILFNISVLILIICLFHMLCEYFNYFIQYKCTNTNNLFCFICCVDTLIILFNISVLILIICFVSYVVCIL